MGWVGWCYDGDMIDSGYPLDSNLLLNKLPSIRYCVEIPETSVYNFQLSSHWSPNLSGWQDVPTTRTRARPSSRSQS